MEQHLRKLKALMLSNAFAHWQQYSEEPPRDNAILQALQVLLQIAELASTSHDGSAASPATQAPHDDAQNKRRRRPDAPPSKAANLQQQHTTGAELAADFTGKVGSESDIELSENDAELELLPPLQDEGYEADGEIPEVSDSEPASAEFVAGSWSQLQPSSRFRTHVVHDGLCRLIVAIIIELTQRCAANPVGWCDSLAQLAKRLYLIRDALGGSLFLLQSFKSLLECNDARLKELQQSVLELVTELKTPETLCTFFSVLSSPAPPVHVVVKHMHRLCVGSLQQPQPFVELEFPISSHGNWVASTAEPGVVSRIEHVRNYHLHCQAVTPFTRAPCVLPITHARLWNAEGFTLSLWLQAKLAAAQRPNSHHSQAADEDTRSLATEEATTRAHIASVGSSHVMLSVYLTNNTFLSFELSKPNGALSARQQSHEQQPMTASEPSNGQSKRRASKTARRQSLGSAAAAAPTQHESTMQTAPLEPHTVHESPSQSPAHSSGIRSALKHTKFVLLNSFSNILHGPHDGGGPGGGGGSSEPYAEPNSLVHLRHFRLLPNKWTHLSIAARAQAADSLDLTIIVDGSLEQRQLSLPCRNVRGLMRAAHAFQAVLLGDSNNAPSRSSNNNSSSYTASRASSLVDVGCPPRFAVSSLMLFNRSIQAPECLQTLTAMGPDFVELTPCQVVERLPNYGFLNLAKTTKVNFGSFAESMRQLMEARMLTYSAQQPDQLLAYEYAPSPSEASAGNGRPLGIALHAELKQRHLQSLQTATLLCGGLSTLLYLFARTVELSHQAATQALALDMLLATALSDSQLYAEFLRQDYFSLIGHVIRSERCSKDAQLLRCIVNNACSQPLIQKKPSESLFVHENTSAAVVHPRLLVSVLQRYSDWHRCGAEHSEVLDMLFHCVLALTREKHPQRDFNMEQLSGAGLFKALLDLCKVYVIASPSPVHVSKCAAQRFVEIVAVFAGSPAAPSLMDEIMKLLLLLHKPSECFVTHDRSKIYFLLSSQPPPARDKTIATAVNLSRVAAPFRRVNFTRERPGLAVPASSASDASASNNGHKPADTSAAAAADTKLQQRINRIRRIGEHSRSPHKRSFEENLESVANCAKLNKNALRVVSPSQLNDWRTKFKCSPKVRQAQRDKPSHSGARLLSLIGHRRVYSSSKISLRASHDLNAKRARSFSSGLLSTSAELSAATTPNTSHEPLVGGHSAEQLNLSDDPLRDGSRRANKSVVSSDFHAAQGIIALQAGLYTLLKNFLCLLPDNAVDEVVKHYIKVEILLVLANHSSCAVRAAIVRLLAALTKRLPPAELASYSLSLSPQHLANQLSIHATDAQLFEACFEWVYGVYGDTESVLQHCELELHAQQRFGVNAMLAVASKLTVARVEYAERAFRLLAKFFGNTADDAQNLIDNGLLQCCVKALHNLHVKPASAVGAKTEAAILDLLTAIGAYSLKSVGHINIIWDLINMLAFYQEKQPAHVVQAFRSVQSLLQMAWINMFFERKINPKKVEAVKVVALSAGSPAITLAETKTRLGLLVDRCCQFFTVFDASYAPTEHEIMLFELLVSYCISTNQRYNNFIAWGLQPSRPHSLRAFIVDKLWECCRADFQPNITCDGKMIRSHLWLCLLEDMDQPIENLKRLCEHLKINENNSAWSLESELERLEFNRCSMSAKQKSLLEKTVYKFEPLALACIESSMVTTRRVTELQNAERKLLMSHMKGYDETATFTKWGEIIRRMTHEGAPWHCKERYENSWELDDTEGPSRVHTRLRRCHLDMDKRFMMPEYDRTTSTTSTAPLSSDDADDDDERNCQRSAPSSNSRHSSFSSPHQRSNHASDYTRPLDYLISNYDRQLNVSLNAQILYNFPAKYLPVDGEIDGEIIITDHKLYFQATYRCKYFYVTCDISNISEIWMKRYQHQEKAFEIYLDSNESLFFSLQNYDDWKNMRAIFCDKIVPQPDFGKVMQVTQQWREGLFTNWEYLMTLNQIAGRTYNDLMQYPVFPWILANYTSEKLDLTEVQNFRRLEKPIAVQHEANEQHYVNNYTYIKSTVTYMGSMVLQPYHYSSHYSNSGTVLYFLVRVPPFTSYFLRYQDNNFDYPDRTFHALSTAWNLASRDSSTDVKELIPEFFCLPEMFENFERFNFGCRQNGERVDNVTLPPWCQRDPRLFVLIHRQALECEVVRRSLHQWIDLIFGFKQTGESAVDAINVFHPATYENFLESQVLDPIERRAVETMIKTYGQMPRQLFKAPHPASKALNYCLVDQPILPQVDGLRWGVYLGSPQLPPPVLGGIHKLPGAEYLVCFSNTNVVYGLPARSCVMQGLDTDTYNVVSWGHDDRIVRIQALNKPYSRPRNLLHNSTFDEITACGTDPNSNQLWLGHRSGRISVYKCLSSEASSQRNTKSRQSYVRGLRLSYNSAFRKMTTESSQSNSGAGLGLVDAAGAAHQSGDGFQFARDASDSVELSWTGPTILIRHSDEVTAISLSVEFKIAVSAGRDGIAVIWDLNDWSYVRTIQRPAEIHHSPVSLIAISATLGDIVTVHTLPFAEQDNKLKPQEKLSSPTPTPSTAAPNPNATQAADECFEVTEESLDDFVNVSINPHGSSMLRLHTVNARYVQHLLQQERILAVCYSYIKEGVGVNVIATAIEGGIVRLWSSWNLSLVNEIVTGITNIKSITYTTHQHLVVLTREAHLQVWETEGLYGSVPKFPQISYK